jgi:hypothetical protein
MRKRFFSLVLVFVMVFSHVTPLFAGGLIEGVFGSGNNVIEDIYEPELAGNDKDEVAGDFVYGENDKDEQGGADLIYDEDECI